MDCARSRIVVESQRRHALQHQHTPSLTRPVLAMTKRAQARGKEWGVEGERKRGDRGGRMDCARRRSGEEIKRQHALQHQPAPIRSRAQCGWRATAITSEQEREGGREEEEKGPLWRYSLRAQPHSRRHPCPACPATSTHTNSLARAVLGWRNSERRWEGESEDVRGEKEKGPQARNGRRAQRNNHRRPCPASPATATHTSLLTQARR